MGEGVQKSGDKTPGQGNTCTTHAGGGSRGNPVLPSALPDLYIDVLRGILNMYWVVHTHAYKDACMYCICWAPLVLTGMKFSSSVLRLCYTYMYHCYHVMSQFGGCGRWWWTLSPHTATPHQRTVMRGCGDKQVYSSHDLISDYVHLKVCIIMIVQLYKPRRRYRHCMYTILIMAQFLYKSYLAAIISLALLSSHLSLTYNSWQGVPSFVSTVGYSRILTHLDISLNHLSIEVLEMLSVALSANSSLKTLGMASCSIDGEGAELLSTELEENRTLFGLDLRHNPINVNGATALASMLTENTSLKMLYLSHSEQIGHVGALRLISALQDDNKTLATLCLPAECEPIEYGSILMNKIRKSGRIEFINNTSSVLNTIAHEFTSLDIWPYN